MTSTTCHRSVRRLFVQRFAPLAIVAAFSFVAPASSSLVHAESTDLAAASHAATQSDSTQQRPGQLAAVHPAPAVPAATGQSTDLAPVSSQSTTAQSDSTPSTTVPPSVAQPPKGFTAKAIDKVKAVAKSAGDIFSRVPCLPPKGGAKSFGALPHVTAKLAASKPVLIIAFGSSSTQGYGSSTPDYNYPNRLAAQLRRKYPNAEITVVNAGVGGEDAPEMIKRLQNDVIDKHPDMVIWQVGTNAVLRDLDPTETGKLVDDGVARIQAGNSDVVLVDLQYSPQVIQRPESANRMIKLLGRIAELRHVGIFPRFEVMREWHERQSIPINNFVYSDGLHLNDWGYACFAQTLGDDIIKSVGQVKLGVNTPSTTTALTYRPM